MLAHSRRHLLIVALLLAAVAVTWGQRLGAASALKQASAASTAQAAVTTPADGPAGERIYFLDVEGWYRITPYEVAARSPYDLSGGSTQAVAAAIPTRLGDWQQAGADQDVANDPAVIEFLHRPTVALQRTYQDAAGRSLVLTVLANTGDDSFLLFSHTPETCYPGVLWQVIDQRRESALLDQRPMYAQYLLTEHAVTKERMLVLYWYAWDNPERDPAGGVSSIRVSLRIAAGQSEAEVLARAWDFVRQIFPATVAWERF